jgi:hypothetical protein
MKDGRKPLILLAAETEILFHANNTGVVEIREAQDAQRVQEENQRYYMPVK